MPLPDQFNVPLDQATLRDLDIPEPWRFGMADKTRFGELDALGHVNNTAYLRWAENFRINYFKEYGIADYSGKPPRLVLRQVSMDFLKEMHVHEPYVVVGRTSFIRSSSFRMDYAIFSHDLRATGHAILVWLDDENAKMPLPQHVRDVMIDRDGAQQA